MGSPYSFRGLFSIFIVFHLSACLVSFNHGQGSQRDSGASSSPQAPDSARTLLRAHYSGWIQLRPAELRRESSRLATHHSRSVLPLFVAGLSTTATSMSLSQGRQSWQCRFCKQYAKATAHYCPGCGTYWTQAQTTYQGNQDPDPAWDGWQAPPSPRNRRPPSPKGTPARPRSTTAETSFDPTWQRQGEGQDQGKEQGQGQAVGSPGATCSPDAVTTVSGAGRHGPDGLQARRDATCPPCSQGFPTGKHPASTLTADGRGHGCKREGSPETREEPDLQGQAACHPAGAAGCVRSGVGPLCPDPQRDPTEADGRKRGHACRVRQDGGRAPRGSPGGQSSGYTTGWWRCDYHRRGTGTHGHGSLDGRRGGTVQAATTASPGHSCSSPGGIAGSRPAAPPEGSRTPRRVAKAEPVSSEEELRADKPDYKYTGPKPFGGARPKGADAKMDKEKPDL